MKLDFNDYFILESFRNGFDVQTVFKIPSLEDFTISASFQNLKRSGLIIEDPLDSNKIILSVKGSELMKNFSPEVTSEDGTHSAQVVMFDCGKTDSEKFEEWWSAFPKNPKWETDDKQTAFGGSRVLKNLNKAKAKEKYLRLLNQGLKHEELLGSLLYEIKLKKLDSVKKKENQMEFFKGMESYFNTERYLLYIDNYKENPNFIDGEQKIKSRRGNVTDI